MVRADLDDKTSLERAFSGAYGAFCVTNFWEHFSPEKELAQAANMAEAARAEGLEHDIVQQIPETAIADAGRQFQEASSWAEEISGFLD